jgi:hypothetical protein
MIEPILEVFAAERGDVLAVLIRDVDTYPGPAMRSGVIGIPSFQLFNHEEAVERITGCLTENGFLARLDLHSNWKKSCHGGT